MKLSIMSVITTGLLMSLLVCVLCTMFKKADMLKRVGPKCMIILLLVMLLRMFLPFEFPYTYSIYIEDIFIPIRYFLAQTLFMAGQMEWTVWRTIIVIWGISVIILFINKARTYWQVMRLAGLLPEEGWDTFCEKYQINLMELENYGSVQLVYCSEVCSPCLVGLKKRYLILPEMNYGKEQMRYIILHELSHAGNRDIAWKLLTELLCMVFWWNPVFCYLKKELFRLIEVKNDLLVTENFSEEEKTGYMECLKDTAVQMVKKDMAASVAFNRSDFKMLKERLEILDNRRSFSRRWQIVLSICACAAMFLTSTIIFEPFSYHYGLEDEDGIPITPENTYLIKNGEQYDVYIENEYWITMGNLKGFEGCSIYDTIEEAEADEKDTNKEGR